MGLIFPTLHSFILLHSIFSRLLKFSQANLVAMDTQMVSSDERLEDDHPAGIGGALKQRVSHLRDVHIGGIGGGNQIYKHRYQDI